MKEIKSWAMPKGPSMNPDYKTGNHNRDHPILTKYFEGAIPEGNYGEGKVIVCDNGTYNLTENSENVENIFKEDLERGI
jgi:hypothetical protein